MTSKESVKMTLWPRFITTSMRRRERVSIRVKLILNTPINLRPNNLIFLRLVNLVKVKDHLSNSKSRTVNALSSNKRVLDKAPRKVKEQLLFLKEFYDVSS